MRGAIISLGSVSSQMVGEAMKKYFDEVDMLNIKFLEVRLGKDSGIFYKGEAIQNYDCIYLKGSFRYANLLRSVSALLEGKVPYMPLPSNSFTIVHNKLLTHLALEQQGIPMPSTFISSTIEEAKELLKRVNYPIVMKFPEGTQGKGVMFADSQSSASSLLDALGILNQPFIIQEFIDTHTDQPLILTSGRDLRELADTLEAHTAIPVTPIIINEFIQEEVLADYIDRLSDSYDVVLLSDDIENDLDLLQLPQTTTPALRYRCSLSVLYGCEVLILDR